LSAGTLFLNWLLVFPFATAVACALYPRLRESRHSPTGSLAFAASAPAAMALLVGLLAALVSVGGRPVVGDYRWTLDRFQFRLRLGGPEAIFLALLCWQFIVLILGRRAAANRASQPSAEHVAREATALCVLLGALAGMIVSRDFITTLFFWQAAAIAAAWLAAFADTAGGQPRASLGMGFLIGQIAASLLVLASFAAVWAKTGTTDPFAAGMSLLFRGDAPQGAASVLLFAGMAVGVAAAAALALRPGLVSLAAPVITVGGFLLLRTWLLLFSHYVLESVSGPMLWACSLAACAILGASVAIGSPRLSVGLVAAGQAILCLFAVAASGASRGLAGPATAYLVAVGAAMPVLGVLAYSLSDEPLVRRTAQRKAEQASSASGRITWLISAAIALALLPVPVIAGGQTLLRLAQGLWRDNVGPVLVLACALAATTASIVLIAHRGQWLPASQASWRRPAVIALALILAAFAISASVWAPAISRHVVSALKEGG